MAAQGSGSGKGFMLLSNLPRLKISELNRDLASITGRSVCRFSPDNPPLPAVNRLLADPVPLANLDRRCPGIRLAHNPDNLLLGKTLLHDEPSLLALLGKTHPQSGPNAGEKVTSRNRFLCRSSRGLPIAPSPKLKT